MNADRLRKTSERHHARRVKRGWDDYRDHALGPNWRTGWPAGSTWNGDRLSAFLLTTTRDTPTESGRP